MVNTDIDFGTKIKHSYELLRKDKKVEEAQKMIDSIKEDLKHFEETEELN